MRLKTKSGEKVTFKEAWSRFKQGLEQITPIQKLENETRGTFITLLGFAFSLFAVIYMREQMGLMAYGLMLIFLGSVITTGLKWLGLRQQLKFFKETKQKSITNLDSILDSLDDETTTEEVRNIGEAQKLIEEIEDENKNR